MTASSQDLVTAQMSPAEIGAVSSWLLHVRTYRDGNISGEQARPHSGSIVAQLTA